MTESRTPLQFQSGPTPVPGFRLRTEFEKTVRMSTYLISWAIVPDDFGRIEGTTYNGKTVS